jgi:hypothetical protein
VFIRIQKDKENGSVSGMCKRAMSVQLDGSVVICVLHAGTFLLDANMKSVSLFCVCKGTLVSLTLYYLSQPL